MVRLDERRSVVFSVSAAVPAPQQLQTNKENVEIMRNKKQKQKNLISQREKIKEEEKEENWKILLQDAQKTIII